MHARTLLHYTCFEAFGPGIEVHARQAAGVGGLHKQIQRLRLVDERASVGGKVSSKVSCKVSKAAGVGSLTAKRRSDHFSY